jgi:hypothetical protein
MWVVLLLGTAVALYLLGLVVWPDASCENFLNDFITDRLNASGKYYFRLYTNNVTVSTSTVLGDFTEATFTGYAAVQGSAVSWSAAALTGHVAFSNAGNMTFTNSSGSPVTVYGIFVTDSGKTKLYFVEADPNAPISIPAGGQYIYTPNQQFKSIN